MKIKNIAHINPKASIKPLDFINYIDTSSVSNGSLLGITYLENNFPSRAKRIIHKSDIIISSVRPNLEHNYFVKNSILNGVCSTGFILVRINPNTNYLPLYVYYFLTSIQRVKLYTAIAETSQTTFPAFNKEVISNLNLPEISLIDQQHIVDTIGSIDELIENNSCYIEKLNHYLELLFSDISEKTSSFIPLSKLITFKKGKKPIKTNLKNIGKPYLTIDAIENKYTLYTNDAKCVLISENDIMMVMDGASSGKVFIGVEGYLGSTLAKIINNSDYSTYSIFLFLKANEKMISKNTTGSAIPHANKDYILGLAFPVINQSIDNYLYSIFNTLIDKRKENNKLKVLKNLYLNKYFD